MAHLSFEYQNKTVRLAEELISIENLLKGETTSDIFRKDKVKGESGEIEQIKL